MHAQVFGSTSSGNCCALWNDSGALLIDCGLGIRYTESCLARLHIPFSLIRGLLITHSHGDHVGSSALRRIIKMGIPLYCHEDVAPILRERHGILELAERKGLLRAFKTGFFQTGDFGVTPFAVQHDSPGGCVGFAITDQHHRAVVSTDIGTTEPDLCEVFRDSNLIIVESNHDVTMLNNSGRGTDLINRIRQTHLSNEESADMVERAVLLSRTPPLAVCLAHISQECNTEKLALDRMKSALKTWPSIGIHPSHRGFPAPIISA